MNWKKIPYYLPGVGLVTHTLKEYKNRKNKSPWYNLRESKDRRALGVYFLETGYLTFAILSKIYLGSYIGKGVTTGNWNPLNLNFKQKTEQIQENTNKKENNLEKTINYEDISK